MAIINVRVDDKLKKEAAELFADLGLDTSTAINMFLRQAINSNGIPFAVERPNAATLAAMKEVDDMEKNPEKYKGYTNVDELFEELLQ
ncbi:MAG: type II toxin-antitoxin system RelB/DinJ family antitoxin [Clostridiales bacterium]|nr:type II toxin-antitoxin system RelB/DinJ family antitoxin [Clostridiales bacterium]